MSAILPSVVLTVAVGFLSAAHGVGQCDVARLDEVDFLVGEWQIEDTTDPSRGLGTSTVTPVAGLCALLESIAYPDGYQELRLLTFDQARGIWQLAIVDSEHGNMILLNGHRTKDRLEFISTQQREASLLADRVSLIDQEDGWLMRIETAGSYGAPWSLVQQVAYVPLRSTQSGV